MIICSCATVSKSEIQRAIRAGAHTLAALGEACEAGTGCQSCHADLHTLLGAHAQEVLAADIRDRAQLPLFSGAAPGAPERAPPAGAHRPSPSPVDPDNDRASSSCPPDDEPT